MYLKHGGNILHDSVFVHTKLSLRARRERQVKIWKQMLLDAPIFFHPMRGLTKENADLNVLTVLARTICRGFFLLYRCLVWRKVTPSGVSFGDDLRVAFVACEIQIQ